MNGVKMICPSKMTESRIFEGELENDWFVIAVRLGDRPVHARIYVRTEADVKEMLDMLAEGEQ